MLAGSLALHLEEDRKLIHDIHAASLILFIDSHPSLIFADAGTRFLRTMHGLMKAWFLIGISSFRQ
jgi:hypothetical protein